MNEASQGSSWSNCSVMVGVSYSAAGVSLSVRGCPRWWRPWRAARGEEGWPCATIAAAVGIEVKAWLEPPCGKSLRAPRSASALQEVPQLLPSEPGEASEVALIPSPGPAALVTAAPTPHAPSDSH